MRIDRGLVILQGAVQQTIDASLIAGSQVLDWLSISAVGKVQLDVVELSAELQGVLTLGPRHIFLQLDRVLRAAIR